MYVLFLRVCAYERDKGSFKKGVSVTRAPVEPGVLALSSGAQSSCIPLEIIDYFFANFAVV